MFESIEPVYFAVSKHYKCAHSLATNQSTIVYVCGVHEAETQKEDTITTTKESVKHNNIIIVLHLEGSTSFQSGPCSRTAVVAGNTMAHALPVLTQLINLISFACHNLI